jgi:hypothetical protein
LGRQCHCLVVSHPPPPRVRISPEIAASRQIRQTPSSGVRHERCVEQERRAVQRERFHRVKRLQAAGLSAAAIMRETGIGRKLVLRGFVCASCLNAIAWRPARACRRFFREYLWQRWTEGCHSVKRLMAEIQPLGYLGGYAGLAKLVARWCHDAPPRFQTRRVGDTVAIGIVTRHVSSPVAAALLGRPRALLSARQAETVDALKDRCPGFTTMRHLMLSSRMILQSGTVSTLHQWMARATATEIEAMQRFVRKLRQDLGAVEGAVTEPWSNGPVEGHINRQKTIRRQMCGRGR